MCIRDRSKYDLWSRYVPEDNAVAIFYASMYGDTENAANILAAGLAEGGIKNIALYDVSVTDVSVLIAEAFRCSHLVFAAPTYNNGVSPAMYTFLPDMGALRLQNRTIGLIENGTWGPVSAKQMQQLFSEMKQMNVLEPVVTVKSSVKELSLIHISRNLAENTGAVFHQYRIYLLHRFVPPSVILPYPSD